MVSAFILLAILSGCNSSVMATSRQVDIHAASTIIPTSDLSAQEATSTITPTSTLSAQRDKLLLNVAYTSAPNGKWGESHDSTITGTVKIVLKNDLSILATIPISPSFGPYVSYKSWSPDSMNLLLYGYDVLFSHAPVSRLVILHFDPDRGELTPYVFEPLYTPAEQLSDPATAWSFDSSKLAVNMNEREIFILDAQGRIIRKFQPYLPNEARVGWLGWYSHDELQYSILYRVKIIR